MNRNYIATEGVRQRSPALTYTAVLANSSGGSMCVGIVMFGFLFGADIKQKQWDKGSIRGLGWSDEEKLLVVTEDGTVRCYYDLQGDFTQFSLGHVRFHASSCTSTEVKHLGSRRRRGQGVPLLVRRLCCNTFQ